MSKNDCYFIISVRSEPIEESRYLFDFHSYITNQQNIRQFKVHQLMNKLQLWKHFQTNRRNHLLYYHFFPVNDMVLRYIERVQNNPLSVHINDFDANYYLDMNPDVKLESRKFKDSMFPWKHFVYNGMFELRPLYF